MFNFRNIVAGILTASLTTGAFAGPALKQSIALKSSGFKQPAVKSIGQGKVLPPLKTPKLPSVPSPVMTKPPKTTLPPIKTTGYPPRTHGIPSQGKPVPYTIVKPVPSDRGKHPTVIVGKSPTPTIQIPPTIFKPIVHPSNRKGVPAETKPVIASNVKVVPSTRGKHPTGKTVLPKIVAASSLALSDSARFQAQAIKGDLTPTGQEALQRLLNGNGTQADYDRVELEQKFNSKLQSPNRQAVLSAVLSDSKSQMNQQAIVNALANGTLPGLNNTTGAGSFVTGLAGLAALVAPYSAGGNGGVTIDPGEIEPAVQPGATPDVVTPPVGPEFGMKINQVLEGGAAQEAELRAGDVLYSVDGKRVRNYDEFRAAVQNAGGEIEVVFFNAESKQFESLQVTPKEGLLGVVVVESELSE